MKKLLVLAFLLIASAAQAAIPAGAVWEVRTAGSDTQGGGFVGGITSKATGTDLVVAAGSNVQVSSVSYGFTSADVGRWITVTAGTGFTVGSYNIISVTTGVATLSASPAAVSTTGGSFTIYYGLDYSQQNAKNTVGSNISTTDAVTAGTTTLVSATAAFTADIVGNIVYISGGTGSITGGWYEVTAYTNATTVTLDRSTGLTAGTGATLNIGGALATPTAAALLATQYNIVYIKGGPYVITAGINFTGSNLTVIGYTTTRNDGGQATIQGSTNTGLSLITAQYVSIYNITVDCNSLGTCTAFEVPNSIINNCKAKNYSSFGIHEFGSSINGTISNNEVTGGTTSSAVGIYASASTGYFSPFIVFNNYVHDGQGIGITTGSGNISYNVIANQTGTNAHCINAGGTPLLVYGNTAYNCAGSGINVGSTFSTRNLQTVTNNILVNNGAYGINGNSNVPAGPNFDGNAFYGNTSGTTHLLNDTTCTSSDNSCQQVYVYTKNVIMTGSPFVNAGSGNFALNTTAGAGGALRGVGLPQAWPGLAGTTSYPSFGPVQPNTTTIAGGSFSFGQ